MEERPKLPTEQFNCSIRKTQIDRRRLLKRGNNSQEYNKQITDIVNRGVAEKLDVIQLKEYNGPIHYNYVARHESKNPSQLPYKSYLTLLYSWDMH